MCFCLSPALVDVDGVDFVSTDGDLGQGLDHMVALQNHISLRGNTGRRKLVFSVGLFFFLLQNSSKAVRCPHLHLLLVVLTGHVQNKHAIAKRADGDACKHSTTISGYFLFKMSITIPNHVTNTR